MTAPLVIRRTYRHRRDRVFRAFSRGELLEQWFSPAPDIAAKVTELRFEPGGRYRIAYLLPDGTETAVAGRYLHIDAPRTLSFTWEWEAPDPHAGIETRVTIDFIDSDGSTNVAVTHEHLSASDMAERHRDGWLRALERLNDPLERSLV